MPYDLTYKWNLKTKQRSEHNRNRDMERKNKLTVTTGEGRGEGNNGAKKGKGLQGTCTKDPWTKTMRGGRVECGMWGWIGPGRVMGINGDNSNCTIKKEIYPFLPHCIIFDIQFIIFSYYPFYICVSVVTSLSFMILFIWVFSLSLSLSLTFCLSLSLSLFCFKG